MRRIVGVLAVAGMLAGCEAGREIATRGVREVILDDGVRVRVERGYLVDRNALVGAEWVGDGVVALTTSGGLLRFDANFRLAGERAPAGYRCLGHDGRGGLLAGRADGGVERISAKDLSGREVGRATGAVRWVGGDKAGRVVAVAEGYLGRAQWMCELGAGGATGRTWELPMYMQGSGASTFLLDDRGRMWVGADQGEWGGWCECMDLATGSRHKVKGPDFGGRMDGVYGITDVGDGSVLLYGGMDHMGAEGAFVYRCRDGEACEEAYLHSAWGKPEDFVPWGAGEPISNIVALGKGKGYAVFSGSGVFHTDDAFRGWEKVASMALRYSPGRPDAMGDYPAVKGAQLMEAGRLLCATGKDGLVEIRDGKVMSHALPGQVDVEGLRFFGESDRGLVVGRETHRSGDYELFWLKEGKETPLKVALPEAGAGHEWRRIVPLRVEGDEMWIAADEAVHAGEYCVVRVEGERTEVVVRGTGLWTVDGMVVTPDGRLWDLEGGRVKVLKEGVWVEGAAMPAGASMVSGRAMGGGTSPWLVMCGGGLWLLRDDGAEGPRVEAVAMKEGVWARDAIGTGAGQASVVTTDGLYYWTFGRVGLSKAVGGFENVSAVARDGQGRTWCGGERLWFEEEGSRPVWVPLEGGQQVVTMVGLGAGGVLAVLKGGEAIRVTVEGRLWRFSDHVFKLPGGAAKAATQPGAKKSD